MKSKISRLADISEVRAGYPIRGQIQDDPEGNARVIQMKHVNEVKGVDWAALPRMELAGRRRPDWLEAGDIVFAARGNRNLAYCLEKVSADVVCSPHFFQIHIKPDEPIQPEFLAWQINQAPTQNYLALSSEGAMIRNIRRKVLESLPIVIPSLEKQAAIVELDKRMKQESILLQQLTENGRVMMNAIAHKLMNES